MIAAIKEAERYLKGKNPLRIEHNWQALYMGTFYREGPVLMSTIGAIDVALWDIAGKYYNTPVYRLLGGPTRNKIRVYVHIGDLPPEKLVENAVKTVKKGYTAVRWAPFIKDYQRMRFPAVMKMEL